MIGVHSFDLHQELLCRGDPIEEALSHSTLAVRLGLVYQPHTISVSGTLCQAAFRFLNQKLPCGALHAASFTERLWLSLSLCIFHFKKFFIRLRVTNTY